MVFRFRKYEHNHLLNLNTYLTCKLTLKFPPYKNFRPNFGRIPRQNFVVPIPFQILLLRAPSSGLGIDGDHWGLDLDYGEETSI